MKLDEHIRFYALENAVKYDGKANVGSVLGSVLGNHPEFRKDVKKVKKKVEEIVKKINQMDLEDQQKEYDELAPEEVEEIEEKSLPELPNAKKGKVITRIPPEPSKYSHIGHALSFLINYMYAKKYDGKCLLRFEDTNPEKSTQEYVDSMLEDLQDYLKIKPDKILYVSDLLPKLYKKAEELIKKKKAYVCKCDRDSMSKHREHGTVCGCVTKKDVKENMKMWKDMLSGKYRAGEAILRLSGDMSSKNYVMRDPVIFRINKTPHYRQKKKYCVWPLYDFENSVLDSLNGITHILRSSEFGKMRIELQDYIKDLLDLPKQEIIQYGRFNIEGATTKGREIRDKIKEGKVSGWDDPSLVTLKALKRRGIVKETYYDLVHEVGLSASTDKNLAWSVIASLNRSILDPKANRYFFIENPKKIQIMNTPQMRVELKLHPEHPDRGMRKLKTTDEFYITEKDYKKIKNNSFIRLMDCLNFTVKKKKYFFDSLEHEKYKNKGDYIIHWLPASDILINVEIRMPDNTIMKGYGESNLQDLEEGDIIQFTRFGFCRLDKKLKNKYVFWFTNK